MCLVAIVAGGALIAVGLPVEEPAAAPVPEAPFSAARPAAVPARVPSSRIGPPDRLLIPSLRVDAPVEPRATLPAGDLVVPGDPRVVARWDGGAPARSPAGTTLLAGHVDADGDLGALHPLHRLTPGALIETTDAAGRVSAWSVVTLEVRRKEELPGYSASGPRRLVLVTCGGPVVRTATGTGYRDNVIAVAEPLA